LLIKHTSALLNADWFVQTRKAYNEFYGQLFGAHRQDGQGTENGSGQQREEKQHRSGDAHDGPMTYKRALEIMELSEGATEQEINAAHKRLIQRVHPDLGGSNFFAKQLNAARDVLLERVRR
jgi:hypothetical protein